MEGAVGLINQASKDSNLARISHNWKTHYTVDRTVDEYTETVIQGMVGDTTITRSGKAFSLRNKVQHRVDDQMLSYPKSKAEIWKKNAFNAIQQSAKNPSALIYDEDLLTTSTGALGAGATQCALGYFAEIRSMSACAKQGTTEKTIL